MTPLREWFRRHPAPAPHPEATEARRDAAQQLEAAWRFRRLADRVHAGLSAEGQRNGFSQRIAYAYKEFR